MWICLNCSESIEDAFDVCWNCGTSRAGKPNPSFQSEAPDPSTDVTTDPEQHYEPLRYSLRAILVFISLNALFFASLALLVKATGGDWAASLITSFLLTLFFLWLSLRIRCDRCGRWWQKQKTGQEEPILGWSGLRREQYRCQHCDHTEWRVQLPGHASSG